MPADEWLERTRQTLADYIPRRLECGNATPAAILVLIYDRDGEAHIVFTERTHQVDPPLSHRVTGQSIMWARHRRNNGKGLIQFPPTGFPLGAEKLPINGIRR